MRQIGVHIRVTESLQFLVDKATRLQVPFFQCFFIIQEIRKIIRPTDKDIKTFVTQRRDLFDTVYLHGSYWINLAGIANNGHGALRRELRLAKKLEFTHIILHAGSAKGAQNRLEGIDAMARTFNYIFKKEHDIRFVLENTAHGNMSVGGDLNDFLLLKEKLDHPEKLLFCIDTAHAHSYGYDIVDSSERESFIDHIANTVGIDSVALIHLNDAYEKCGSRHDRHQVVGEGEIGQQALKAFVMHKRLAHIPIIMELPIVTESKELSVLNLVRSWHV